MAGAADKKQAQRNIESLSSVHKLSLIINLISIICIFIIKRPLSGKICFILFSIPSIFCEYTIEKIGRPKYTKNGDGYTILLKSGEDLQQSGLTEYMFDIIYLTLLIDLLMCIFGSMKVWWILLIIPIFAAWKLKGIVSTILGMFMPNLRRGGKKSGIEGEEESDDNSNKSKRQLKKEKRGDKQKVRYR